MGNSSQTYPEPLRQALQRADRVYYATGVLLDADDFGDEQTYHRRQLARALAYLHGSGTVAGLAVAWQGADDTADPPVEEQLFVQPGLAIDRLGRLIELHTEYCIRLNRWYEQQTAGDLRQGFSSDLNGVVVDVFIRFAVCERRKTPAFAAGGFDALDAVVPSRLRDGYHLSLVIRTEDNLSQNLPVSPWPAPNGNIDELHDAILDAWHEGTDDWDEQGPNPRPEHAEGQDTTDIFLARLTLPAADIGAGEKPERIENANVIIDNHSRSFVYSTEALARWLGVI